MLLVLLLVSYSGDDNTEAFSWQPRKKRKLAIVKIVAAERLRCQPEALVSKSFTHFTPIHSNSLGWFYLVAAVLNDMENFSSCSLQLLSMKRTHRRVRHFSFMHFLLFVSKNFVENIDRFFLLFSLCAYVKGKQFLSSIYG